MIYSRILGTGSYLPKKLLTNADLESIVDTSDEWIVERTGIRRRHLRENEDNTITMAVCAAKNALLASDINLKQIGLIIVATSTPDRLFPNTASLVQLHTGLNSTECMAFDISAACVGFISALSIADQYIRAGRIDCALVIGSESLTRLVNWQDRSTCILFGDGAGAVVLGVGKEPGVYSTHLHADGTYNELLVAAGDLYTIEDKPCHIQMRGNELFKIAVSKLDIIVNETLRHNEMEKSDIDWLIPHQANLRIIKAAAKKLNIPWERVIVTIEDQGNTSAASIPLALDIGVRDGRIRRGELMLLEAFGAGLGWGSALIKF